MNANTKADAVNYGITDKHAKTDIVLDDSAVSLITLALKSEDARAWFDENESDWPTVTRTTSHHARIPATDLPALIEAMKDDGLTIRKS